MLPVAGTQYQLQYRVTNRHHEPDADWQYKRVETTEARLQLRGLQDGDEVEIEVSRRPRAAQCLKSSRF